MSRSTSTAELFGAKIKVSLPGRALYLVIGHGETPDSLITRANGTVVYNVPDTHAVMALLPVTAYFALNRHHLIAHIGPVSIDAERFNHFLSLISVQHNGQKTS